MRRAVDVDVPLVDVAGFFSTRLMAVNCLIAVCCGGKNTHFD